MKIYISSLLFLLITCFEAKAQQEMLLYEGKIPNSKASVDKEKSEINKDGFLILSDVSVPTITAFEPKISKPNHTAVIICPGGAYGILAAGHEGADVAQKLSNLGITAFVLKYRLPNDSIMIDKSIGPLQDAQKAIQMVRENAAKWNIDPAKIGIMGFSAGGHLAASASTHYEKALIDNPKNTSLRPDFSILIYPIISFTDKLAHMGSRDNLIGEKPSEEQIMYYSNELQVTSQTPPAFLVHCTDDSLVPVGNSIAYDRALRQNELSQ
ncbi:alpha/beta hydrolase [Flavobacterium sp. 3HN19-14]|uniref:alpha/beta hydrolase n=1 Tax=Flavobacterium sp. 3HN19-14 TaxID=3448133 RepID=UPI003EE35B08